MELSRGDILTLNGHPFRAGFLAADNYNLEDRAKFLARHRRENTWHEGGKVYHYTTVTGFYGIIESKGFWASDNRFMNDAEERTHAVELILSVLAHVEARSKAPAFRGVVEGVRERFTNPDQMGNLVACFSTARDSLEQWRAYGQPSGVCIELNGNVDHSGLIFYGPDALPHKVFYDRRSKLALLMSLTRRYERQYQLDREAMPDVWPTDHDQQYINALVSILSFRTVAFKNAAFRQEAEVRIVISPDIGAERFGGLKFRPSLLGIIPYICTGDRQIDRVSKLPISGVMVGPAARQDLIADSVRSFMDAKGYSAVPVTQSKIPFRS